MTPLAPKKSCADRARNSVARVAARIRTGHYVFSFHRIRRRRNDICWFCHDHKRMTRSHVLLCTLLRFIELSGAGRVVDEVDVEEE